VEVWWTGGGARWDRQHRHHSLPPPPLAPTFWVVPPPPCCLQVARVPHLVLIAPYSGPDAPQAPKGQKPMAAQG